MEEFIKYFWLFMFGSTIGFICETIWCIIKNKKIESRKGLIYGHYTPVYGITGVAIAILVEGLNITNLAFFFILTFFVSSFVEYYSSVFQEKCFGTVSWDYTDMKYSIDGRVNLKYSFMWGSLGVLWCKYYPIMLEMFFGLLNKIGLFKEISAFAILFMGYNCLISIIASYRQKQRRNGIAATNKVEVWLDEKYTDEYLEKIYANAKVVDLVEKVRI